MIDFAKFFEGRIGVINSYMLNHYNVMYAQEIKKAKTQLDPLITNNGVLRVKKYC